MGGLKRFYYNAALLHYDVMHTKKNFMNRGISKNQIINLRLCIYCTGYFSCTKEQWPGNPSRHGLANGAAAVTRHGPTPAWGLSPPLRGASRAGPPALPRPGHEPPTPLCNVAPRASRADPGD